MRRPVKRTKRHRKLFNYIFSTLWIFLMSILGFFLPFFIDNIDFFRIKTLYVEGIETIPPEIVVNEIKQIKNNWLFINSSMLLHNLNSRTGNSINNVKIDRIFTSRGVELKITIEERKPIITVIKDDSVFFFDEHGVLFQSSYIELFHPLIYAHDIEFLRDNFANLRGLIDVMGSSLEEIYITNLKTVVYTKNKIRIVMPQLSLLNKQYLEYIKYVFEAQDIDSMNIREIELNIDGMLILKEGKSRF